MKVSARGGRPRGFDRAQAVDTAMLLFWRHGYEGVSLAMLTEAIGIAPPSLYAAFGSKAGLYRETLDHYVGGWSAFLSPMAEAATLRLAVQDMLDQAIASATDPRGGRGCMVSIGLLACHPDHADLARDLASHRRALMERMALGLERWLPQADAAPAARFLCAVLQGIAVQAKDGATAEELRTIAASAASAIDQGTGAGVVERVSQDPTGQPDAPCR